MAVVLVIDENAEEHNERLGSIKGVRTYCVRDISEASSYLKFDQFDIILAQPPEDEYEVKVLMRVLAEHQPESIELFWMVVDEDDLKCSFVKSLPGEKILVKPITEGDIGINPDDLMIQNEIDGLFD